MWAGLKPLVFSAHCGSLRPGLRRFRNCRVWNQTVKTQTVSPKGCTPPLCQAGRHPKSAQELANSLNRNLIHDHRSLATVLHIISHKSLHWFQAEEVSMAVGRRGEETPAPPSFSRFLPPSPRRFLLRICTQLSAKSQKTPLKSFVCGILRNKPFVFNASQSEIKD